MTTGDFRNIGYPLYWSTAISLFFAVIGLGQGGNYLGFLPVLLLWVLVTVLLIPVMMVIRGRLNWTSSLSIISFFGMIGFGIPAFHHVFLRKTLISRTYFERTILQATPYDITVTLGLTILAFTCLILSYNLNYKSFLYRIKIGSEPRNFSILVGFLMVLIGIWSISHLYGSVATYMGKFWSMGIRIAAEQGKSRYVVLGGLAIPGAMIFFLGLHERYLNKNKISAHMVLLICFLAGGIPIFNTGGRTVLIKYTIGWLMAYHLRVKNLKLRRLALPILIVLVVVILIGRVRYASYLWDSQPVSLSEFISSEAAVPQPIGLSIDKISATMFTHIKKEENLFGETYLAGIMMPFYRPLEIMGLGTSDLRPWTITNYHGSWATGDHRFTGVPSSMIGEDFANFGVFGVMFGSTMLGFLMVYIDRKFLLKRGALHGRDVNEKEVFWARFTPIETVITITWVVYILPKILFGGWGSLMTPLLFQLAPLYLVYSFGSGFSKNIRPVIGLS